MIDEFFNVNYDESRTKINIFHTKCEQDYKENENGKFIRDGKSVISRKT